MRTFKITNNLKDFNGFNFELVSILRFQVAMGRFLILSILHDDSKLPLGRLQSTLRSVPEKRELENLGLCICSQSHFEEITSIL